MIVTVPVPGRLASAFGARTRACGARKPLRVIEYMVLAPTGERKRPSLRSGRLLLSSLALLAR